MSFIVGESGKNFFAHTGVDMSTNTELEIVFTKPDGTTSIKTQTAGEVALGVVGLSFQNPDGETITALANEYLIYSIEPLFLDQAGSRDNNNAWKAYPRYTDTATAPDTVIIGACTEFDVTGICP